MRDTYERKISAEEAAESYVMVLKDRLDYFPAIGETFQLNGAAAKVESRRCECRGPEKPHEHYFIRRQGLAKGQLLSFSRAGEGYVVSVS